MADEKRILRSKNLWYKLFLEHPNETDNPQGYWAHGKFSVTNSLKGIVYMLAGVIHGIFPILFSFTTSSWIIRSFVKLVESERHQDELKKYVSQKLVRQLRRDTKEKLEPEPYINAPMMELE